MDVTTLEKANELNRKIKEFGDALICFEFPQEYGGGSTNPRIIIEHDGFDNDREETKLPMNLSDNLISFLKDEIIKWRDIAVAEFNAL